MGKASPSSWAAHIINKHPIDQEEVGYGKIKKMGTGNLFQCFRGHQVGKNLPPERHKRPADTYAKICQLGLQYELAQRSFAKGSFDGYYPTIQHLY
jgi:hypothetical protein